MGCDTAGVTLSEAKDLIAASNDKERRSTLP